MIDEERGTCPCGHEVIRHSGGYACLVWDEHGEPHKVPFRHGEITGRECSCHGTPIIREWRHALL